MRNYFSVGIAPPCSFCKSSDETSLHSRYECNSLKLYDVVILSLLMPGTAIFGMMEQLILNKNRLLKNHILFIFKLYVHNFHEK